MSEPLDISYNRRARKWSNRELIGRLIWEVIGTHLFAWSPRQAWAWRRWILSLFGANIGRGVRIYPSVKIAVVWNLTISDDVAIGDSAVLYSLGVISIGARTTISQYAHLCAGTHDYRSVAFDLIKSPITIGSDVWICADAFVGPGVTIGDGAILGARAVTLCNIPGNVIAVGNPAHVTKVRT